MKKAFYVTLFAAMAMICATSCEEDSLDPKENETPTEEVGNYPKDLTGYWIPVDSIAGGSSYIIVGETRDGKADCSVHIDGAPIDLMAGHITYDSKTGAGTFELEPALAQQLNGLVVKLQAKGQDLLTVSRSIDGGNRFESADFKRVKNPNDNGGDNGGNDNGGDTIARTWPESPMGHYAAYDDTYGMFNAMINEEEIDGVVTNTLYLWNPENLFEYVVAIEYDPATGRVRATLTEVADANAQYEPYIASAQTVMEFIDEDTFTIKISANGIILLDMTFVRQNPEDIAGKK